MPNVFHAAKYNLILSFSTGNWLLVTSINLIQHIYYMSFPSTTSELRFQQCQVDTTWWW